MYNIVYTIKSGGQPSLLFLKVIDSVTQWHQSRK